jgi:bacteriocin-like protein
MRNNASRNELTIDELNAVSGGSLPLPAIVATIVRAIVGPDSPPPPPPGTANGWDSTGPLLPY